MAPPAPTRPAPPTAAADAIARARLALLTIDTSRDRLLGWGSTVTVTADLLGKNLVDHP